MKKIIIVGAGFAGVRAALDLEKNLKWQGGAEIILIDPKDYHLFPPNLYEIATSDEELVSIKQAKKSLVLPLEEIFSGKKIKLIKGRVSQINPLAKQITLNDRQLDYDYLVWAAGSQTDYLQITGAKEFGLPLKTFADAMRLRNRIEFVFAAHSLDMTKKNLQFVVAGGGYSGVELAGELKNFLDFLAWKHNYPREKVEIMIIEAAPKLLLGFDDKLSTKTYARLLELGVHIRLSDRVSAVDRHYIELMSGEKIAYDILAWTVGVKASGISCSIALPVDNKERLCVNEYLLMPSYHNILVLGDAACVTDKTSGHLAGSAQEAVAQGRYAAYALPYIMENKKPTQPYKSQVFGLVVALGGKWAIFSNRKYYLSGFLAYALGQLAHLRYYASLVGWVKAVKYLWLQEKLYGRND